MKNEIRARLISLADEKYRAFNLSLMPTVPQERILGVRTPLLRAYIRELRGKDISSFIGDLPHKYCEEDNLHAFWIAEIKDFDLCVKELEAFLPYIDNWGTCDCLRPKCFKGNSERLLPYIYKWLSSERVYTVRFAIGMLMSYYLDENFDPKYPEALEKIKSDEYYINMMLAWYFATALAKQWDFIISFIEEKRLGKWVHNKAIQKSIESYRISDSQKSYLKTLKIK